MPDWEYMEWSESNYSIEEAPLYVQQAYAAKKYAFVSDYVRLHALAEYGGIYLDTDVEVLQSYEPLVNNTAFIGFEESQAHLPGTCVMGCKAGCKWIRDMIATYDKATFIGQDGSLDLTTNVQRLGEAMIEGGLVTDGKEQFIEQWELRIYPHQYFSPITSTRVMRKNNNTYSIHHFEGSWHDRKRNKLLNTVIVREIINALVQIKRTLTKHHGKNRHYRGMSH